MDLRNLTYFLAVAETGHMGRAAEQLNLSQPPLSRQIQQLERELGAALFIRTAHGMALTAAGEALRADAQNIVRLVKQAADRATLHARGLSGRLDIGVYGSAMYGAIPALLSAFRASHPQVELVLHHAQTPHQIPALRQGRVHLLFERLRPEQVDIEVELAATEATQLALSADHVLAREASVHVSQLQGQQLLIGSSPSAAAEAVALCRAHGFEPRFAPPCGDLIVATMMAGLGDGVAIVPASMARVSFPGVVYRPLRSVLPFAMDLYCCFMRGPQPPLVREMLAVIRAHRVVEDVAQARAA